MTPKRALMVWAFVTATEKVFSSNLMNISKQRVTRIVASYKNPHSWIVRVLFFAAKIG
jgi:hypothetical protein